MIYFLHPSDISHRSFEDVVSASHDEASLSSPEVLRRLECSEDRIPERFHGSALGSRLSDFSALNSTGLDLHQVKSSPRVVMEPPHSRTITPDPATQSTHSPGSVSVSDNFSLLDSLDTDKVRRLSSDPSWRRFVNCKMPHPRFKNPAHPPPPTIQSHLWLFLVRLQRERGAVCCPLELCKHL